MVTNPPERVRRRKSLLPYFDLIPLRHGYAGQADTGQNLGSLLPPITATHTVLPAGPFGLYEPSSDLPAHRIAALPITSLPTCSPPLISLLKPTAMLQPSRSVGCAD